MKVFSAIHLKVTLTLLAWHAKTQNGWQTVIIRVCIYCKMGAGCDDQHINLAELSTKHKGINLTLPWLANELHLQTNSFYMYHLISYTLPNKVRICMKATIEMLTWKRLSTFKGSRVICECDVGHIKPKLSRQINQGDSLAWLDFKKAEIYVCCFHEWIGDWSNSHYILI